MRRRATTAVAQLSAPERAPRVISFAVLVLILLTWSSAARGNEGRTGEGFVTDPSTPASQTTFDGDGDAYAEDGAESVTMSIALEEDGVIDVDAPEMDVKIEKWDGDDVLLIVEKKRPRPTASRDPPSTEAVTIQVTREGKNVHIETAGGLKGAAGFSDLSFRIVLPEDHTGVKPCDQTSAVECLAAMVWRALGREALRWFTR